MDSAATEVPMEESQESQRLNTKSKKKDRSQRKRHGGSVQVKVAKWYSHFQKRDKVGRKSLPKPTVKGLSRLKLWHNTWLNSKWRRRWRKKWGANRWKSKLRDKWRSNKKWRKKWMKKLRKNWWNMRWRRMWLKLWLDPNWWAKLERERKRRKKYWMRQWKKSGCKRMGLTFHQYLVTVRRLKLLKNVRPSAIQKRRRCKRLNKEKLIRQKQFKRELYNEERKKYCFFWTRWVHWMFQTEHFGPETFGIRPPIVQFKLYMLIAIQGLVAFIIISILHITYAEGIPEAFALPGLLVIAFYASVMDMFGSIFGMLTSYHLESYYGQRPIELPTSKPPESKSKPTDKSWKHCFGLVKTKVGNLLKETESVEDVALTESARRVLGSQSTLAGILPKVSSNVDLQSWRKYVKKGNLKSNKKKRSSSRKSSRLSRRRNKSQSSFASKRVISKTSILASSMRSSETKLTSRAGSDDLVFVVPPNRAKMSVDTMNELDGKASKKERCQCKGFNFLYCRFLRACFSAGRSRTFINRLGYTSWILLQMAWFFNLFFIAYYTWIKFFSDEYRETLAKCSVLPIQLYCYNFNILYFELQILVVVTFVLRNVFLFAIGMCFSERHLKHCQPLDPNYEIASTCSDTDIDYDSIPQQILIPFLLSNGKFPYVYPGSEKPRKITKKELKRELKEKSRKKAKERTEGLLKEEKQKRRLLSAQEKEAEKMMQGFRDIRRANVPLPKGKRRQLKIPVVTGVPDAVQLPPELMTTTARAWLSEDDDSNENAQSYLDKKNAQPRRRRKRRKPGEVVESNSLLVLHGKTSKIRQPIEKAIKQKVENIVDRISTDESWSSNETLFDVKSGYVAEVEDYDDHNSDEAYMELMQNIEEITMPQRQSDQGLPTDYRKASVATKKDV